MLSLAEEYHEEHVGAEAETVAQVLDEYAEVDDEETVGHVEGEEHVGDVGDGDGEGHRPQPALQSVAACHDSAEDSAEEESDDAHRAVYQSEFHRRKPQSAPARLCLQEELRYWCEQCFGQTEQQHEGYGEQYLLLLEECGEGGAELSHQFAGRALLVVVDVFLGMRQDVVVIKEQGDEQPGEGEEYQAPRILYLIAEHDLQAAGEGYERPLAEDHRQAVERAAYAHE